MGWRDERAREVVRVDVPQLPGELVRLALLARERRVARDRLAAVGAGACEVHHRGRARVAPRALVLLRRRVEAPGLLPFHRLAELDRGLVELHEAAAEDRPGVGFAAELLRRRARAERERRDDGPVAGELTQPGVLAARR